MTEETNVSQKPVKEIIEKYNKLAPQQNKLDIRDDREKLLARLRLSREELDTYIRHSKKIIEEKKIADRENQELKTNIDILNAKIARLEKFDSTLRIEFTKLCQLVQNQNVSTPDSENNLSHLKVFLVKFLDDPNFMNQTNEFFEEFDKLKRDTVIKQNIIDDLERQIEELSKKQNLKVRVSNEIEGFLSEDTADSSPAEDRSNDEKVFEDLKNQLIASYMEQLQYINVLVETLEHKRLCKIDKKTHFPDLDQFNKTIDNVSPSETCLSLISGEFSKKLKFYIDNLIAQIEYLDKKAYEFFQNNESLLEEVENMKYALSHRMEMKEIRQAAKVEACNCSVELLELKEEIQKIKKELKIKETELEIAEENKFSLIQLLASMTNTEGQDYDENEEDTSMEPSPETIENTS